MEDLLYPESPIITDDIKLGPSLAFRKQVSKVIASIIFFLIVYFLLVVAAAALAVLCFYAGGALIIALPKIFTVIIGLGLMCVGVSVIYFLIKFVFASSKDENPSRVEITESEQPRLFAFIRQLSKETQTPFPKKIFISPDVNACVFYNSGFWSMFLPVKKNLEIGLGLVNSINVSEFKAVVAHEFGHFSQRSMKLGSFTYNVNRVIYNMLYDNRGYTQFLNTWGQAHSYLVLFAQITAKIAGGIQWVLRGVYRFVNKNYLGLSREMEFHADAVAASVSGGNNLISSLSRIEIAGDCYQNALNNANVWLKENKVSKNIFDNQLSILRSWAKEHELPLKQGLPEVSYQFIQSISKSRINYKNQWASHPTLEERKSHLELLSLNIKPNETSAWELFDQAGKLQEQMTKILYRPANLVDTVEILDGSHFEETHSKEKDKYKLPLAYKGFYTNRYINIKDWEIDKLAGDESKKPFEELFSKENGSLQMAIDNNNKDLMLVKAIKEKQIDLKTFDFDGAKYNLDDCDFVIEKLEKEITADQEQLKILDKEAFIFFYTRDKAKSGEIKARYLDFQSVSRQCEEYLETANQALKITQPFYDGGLTLEQINSALVELKDAEKKLKFYFAKLQDEGIITEDSNKELFDRLTKFISSNNAYFISSHFVDTELNDLRELSARVFDEFNDHKFRIYKNLLEEQLDPSIIKTEP